MKRYITIFLSMAVLIMSIPCFSFTGSSPKTLSSSDIIQSGSSEQEDPSIETFRVYNHKTKTVEVLSASDYIKRVVAAEMPASYHPEALKAQAVAAHTYAIKMKQQQAEAVTPSLNGADISTDPSTSQGYMSIEELKTFYGEQFEASYQKISNAVDAVINQVILYQEEPIAAAFHAISGGITEDAANIWGRSLPYLQPVLSDGDRLSSEYETKFTFSSDELKEKLSAAFGELTFSDNLQEWIIIKARTTSNSVKEVSVCGKTVSGSDLRSALGLSSAYFSLKISEENFIFNVQGKGHGVGMSQYGADHLARQGKTYDEILAYYYHDVTIATIQQSDQSNVDVVSL